MKESKSSLQQKSLKILLVGESCYDEYHYGTCNRISPEAPVPIFDFDHASKKQGMAYNVKQNLESFGCQVDFITNEPSELIKRRYIDIKSNQQLMREDVGASVNPAIIPFDISNYDAVVISDYNRGLITPDLIKIICANYNGLKFVDTKKVDLSCFLNCILKYNDYELTKIVKHSNMCEEIVTRGKMGANWRNKSFPAPMVELHDVTGAGDVFLASLAYFYSVTMNMDESIRKSVILASKSVQHSGVYKLTDEDIDEICN